MRTIDEEASTGLSFGRRILRDARLLWRIAQMVRAYLTDGRRIRKRYRDLAQRGETFWVDEELSQ